MKNKKDEIECLALTVYEIKSMYGIIEKSYNNLINKFIFFSSGQLAFLAYLYGSGDTEAKKIERLFIPIELSSQIVYVIGIVLAVLSLVYLFQGFLPVPWILPPNSNDLKKFAFDSKGQFLFYLKDEYFKAYKHNSSVYESKYLTYKKGLVCFVIGNIILFIIRFFGNITL